MSSTEQDQIDASSSGSAQVVAQGPVAASQGQGDELDAKLYELSIGETSHRYRMDHKSRGHFIIINNKNFLPHTGMSVRSGTDQDAANLRLDFKRLGFTVTSHNDLKAEDMLKIMIEASKIDHKDCDSFGVAVLTHGDNSILYGVDNVIEVDKFLAPVKSCPSLAGKPKIFIFQACRGTELDEGIEVCDAQSSPASKRPPRTIPMEADYLYAYSTVPGYFSWRNSSKGSWFVQALHKMLDEYAFKMDFLRLLTRVNHEVAYEFESNASQPHMNKKKQIPSIVSMLTKDLYFTEK